MEKCLKKQSYFKGVRNLLGAVFFTLTCGHVAQAMDQEFEHPGYLSSVEDERYQESKEVMIVPYAQTEDFALREKIFTEKLSREFKTRYEDKFGRSELQQIQSASNRFVDMNGGGRLVPYDEHIEKQEDFGKYMAKRLTEYHLDNYLKSGKSTRKIYEAKEAISNMNVAVSGNYSLKIRYKLSANTIDFRYTKPNEKFHNLLLLEMGGSSGVKESKLRLWYNYTKDIDLITQYAIEEEIYTVAAERKLTPNLRTSVTGEKYNKYINSDYPEQERIMFGVSWSD